MLNKGNLVNEFDEVIGKYWYRSGQNSFCVRLWGKNQNGYTEDGIYKLANRLGLYVVEDRG